MTRTEVRRTQCRDVSLAICVAIESADLLTSIKVYLSVEDAERLLTQLGEAITAPPKPVGLPSGVAA